MHRTTSPDISDLRPGDQVRLVSKPTGHSSQHLPLTVGRTYDFKHFDGSNVVTSTDEPDETASYWRGRVEKG